jgi:hypothetical protein
MMVGLRRIAR